jgi:geranylgeranyl diphosphate synthase type I
VEESLWDNICAIKGDFMEQMNLLEEELRKSIPEDSPRPLYNASRHLIMTRGKRIRPALLVLSFDAVNHTAREIEYVSSIANAVELIHTATIVHDDIIDKSSMRRGVKTVNAQWGEDTALLAGDMIFSKAFGMIGTHENREISEIISTACTKLAEGEVLETLHTRDVMMTEEVYLEIIERKTAALFEACTRCGAILGGGTEEEIEALSRYGYQLGIGFQMTDDLLDIVAGEAKFGKPIGIDISRGKPTFIILHALRVSKGEDRRVLEGIIQKNMNSPEDLQKAMEIIKRTNSIRYASKRAKEIIKKAKDDLKNLKDSDAKNALEMIADHAISREF